VNKCLECGAETNNPKFCSRSHAATYNNKRRPGPNFIDETGNVYGDLIVASRAENTKCGSTAWIVQCSCGNISTMTGERLRRGSVNQCDKCSGIAKNRGFATSGAGSLYGQYKYNARARNLVFDLTIAEFENIIRQSCTYCGGTSEFFSGFIGNGIDRIDSSLGYAASNIVPCCSVCNKMKSKLSVDEFISQCDKISQHNHP